MNIVLLGTIKYLLPLCRIASNKEENADRISLYKKYNYSSFII